MERRRSKSIFNDFTSLWWSAFETEVMLPHYFKQSHVSQPCTGKTVEGKRMLRFLKCVTLLRPQEGDIHHVFRFVPNGWKLCCCKIPRCFLSYRDFPSLLLFFICFQRREKTSYIYIFVLYPSISLLTQWRGEDLNLQRIKRQTTSSLSFDEYWWIRCSRGGIISPLI